MSFRFKDSARTRWIRSSQNSEAQKRNSQKQISSDWRKKKNLWKNANVFNGWALNSFPCSLFYPWSFKTLLLTRFCFFANKQHRSTLDYHQIHKHLCDLLLFGNRGHDHIHHRGVHLIRLWINIQITNLHRLAKHQLRQVALDRWGDLITERFHADVLQRCVQ